ncbi:type-F conjugative transfer system pilin assembly protein TrbC [Dechloromonas agitata]|uniref:type-F conjugative transfer system pilin assembly protein TrbC n=1 Tax=Dechloromonas agitata TaxID=73030 RepID=UPI00237EDA42|nr:type-F conjugative transfer system pilin assembly protein TrbC [Dechloromonas agitata]MDE1543952.1 type-F conjugative transfer system pilin assembly protein TrbC [Dechloromonas agitata]
MIRRFAVLATLLLSAQAVAQPTPVITDDDLARVRRETPTVTEEDVRRVQQRHAVPVPVPSPAPRIDALPQPLTNQLPDLGDIAQGYAHTPGSGALPATAPGLFVFVSLAMPEPTLARLVDQAARAKASILIRGFANGSLRETAGRIQKLIGQREVAVLIDPQAFERYAVKRVPTFVLARDGARPAACTGGTCPPPTDYVSTAGDVSLDYALDQLRRAAPRFESEAGVFLARLKR